MTADVSLLFCTAQDVFGNGTTVSSTDWLDMRVVQDWAAGTGPVVEVIVTTPFAGGTAVRFEVVAVDAAGANPVVLDTTPTIALANVGSRVLLRMSPQRALPAGLSHLRLRCVNVGNNSAGAITAALTDETSSQFPSKAYPVPY